MAKKEKEADVFNEENEVPSNWIKFNIPQEDKIFGTLLNKRQVKNQMKEGNEMQWVYDLKVEYGSFHELDDKKKVIIEPIVIQPGEFYSLGGKDAIDRQMQNIKFGQKVGFKFIEEIPAKTKGYNPTKVIKVYAPKNAEGDPLMDEEWIAEQKNAHFDEQPA